MISRIITPSHGLIFGFRWSLVGLCIALFYIASCDLFVPPDNNKPRFNTVHGEKRRPELNPGGQNYRGMNTMDERQRGIDAVYGTGAPMHASPTLTTPAGPLTTPAPAPAPAAVPPAPAPQSMRSTPQQEESFWSRLAFWRDDEARIPETPASQRRAPAENLALNQTNASVPATPIAASELAPPPGAAPMQMAASDYPKLYTTPQNPGVAANDNTRQRLDATRAELEAERSTATSDRDRLARDAVAEPSLLESLPAMRDSGQLPPLPPPPAGANMQIPAPAPLSAPAPRPAAMPVAQAPVHAPLSTPAPRPATDTSAFQRLTSQPLERSKPVENPAPAIKAPAMAAAPAPIAPAPAPKLVSVAPPDASIPLTPQATAPRAIDIAPPPAVASVAPPPPARPALEPIRLTPPSGMLAGGMAAAPSTPSAAAGKPMQLTEPVPYASDAGFLPGSRYSQRRRM